MYLVRRQNRNMFPYYMNRMLNDMLTDYSEDYENKSAWKPPVDMTETENTYEFFLDLPGVDKKDINISIQNNELTIEGERKLDEIEKDERCCVSERTFGQFTRSFTLPEKVDQKDIKAVYNDGVLKITLKKAEETKAKEIKIV